MRVIGLFFILVFGSAQSFALDSVTAVPNQFYQRGFLTLEDTVLGSTCYSIKATTNSLDCNPALLHYDQKRQFRFNLLVDKRTEDLIDYAQKIDDDDVGGLINQITDENRATASKIAASLWYQRDWWAVGYSPLRVKHASNIMNPAYPQLAVSLVKESEVFLKGGVGFAEIDGLSVGLSVRYLSQEYVHRQEDLFDVIADPNLAKIEKNDLITLEPGLAYKFNSDAWKPVLSVVMTHLDVFASNKSYKKLTPGAEVGFSSTPEFASGRLQMSTHYSVNEPNVQAFKRLRWGARYDFDGNLSVIGNITKGDYGVGVQGALDSVILGAAYKNEELDYARWNSKASETFMAELGLRF